MTLTTETLHLDQKLRGGILLEAANSSFISTLGVQQPIDLTTEAILSFTDFSGHQAVGEGEAKTVTPVNTKLIKIERGPLVSQFRLSSRAVQKSEANGQAALTNAYRTMSQKLGESIDILLTHGTSPNSGEKSTDFNRVLAAGEGTRVQAIDDVARPDLALQQAIADTEADGTEITGVVVTPHVFSKIKTMRNTTNESLRYPLFQNMPVNHPDLVFSGYKMHVSKNLGKTSVRGAVNGSGVDFLIGDFRQIVWGMEVLSVELIEHGDPDNTGRDLKGHNEVMPRLEVMLESTILDKSRFVVGRKTV